MPSLKNLTSIWNNIKEFEVAPIQREALQELRIILAGAPGSGRHTLAAQMRTDPHHPQSTTLANLQILSLEEVERPAPADLLILLIDATSGSFAAEQAIARRWQQAPVPVVVIFNKLDLLTTPLDPADDGLWEANYVLRGSVKDPAFLAEQFVPAVWELLIAKQLALGRNFPLFRVPIARQLINETSFANAAYALSTGIAEVIPVLDIPLNFTDMVILTKAQAFMVYRLGLLLGYSIYWQGYLSEFGGIIGGGFLWRQVARELVGLIPVWGIVPKVAISYAGTFVMGSAVMQWYLTGRKLSRSQLNALYSQALEQGRQYARRLIDRLPRLKLARPKLPALKLPTFKLPARAGGKPAAPKLKKGAGQVCAECGQTSAADASFCQYCGRSLAPQPPEPPLEEIPLE